MAKADLLEPSVASSAKFRKPEAQMLKYEIINGLFRMLPTISIRHQTIALRIASMLLSHIEFNRSGRLLLTPCAVVLAKEIIVQPDIIYVRKDRIGLIQERTVRGAPDLVIEIASTEDEDFRNKKNIYSRHGVRELWAVDEEKETVEVLEWSEMGYGIRGMYGKDDRVRSISFPRIRMAVKKIF
jgi:Uma2 family endonuclease